MKSATIIPAYNEQSTIAEVIESAKQFGLVIVVDDGSEDDTALVAQQSGAKVVSHSANKGYDAAIESGFAQAASLGVEMVVTLDADGQHNPEIVSRVMARLSKDRKKLVIGIRRKGARISEMLFNYYVQKRFGIKDVLCGLKGYHMSLYQEFGSFSNYESVGTELALYGLRNKVPMSLVEVPISNRQGKPRFASRLIAEKKILYSLYRAILADIHSN